MNEYILRMEDHYSEDTKTKYYKCIDIPYFSLGEDALNKLPKLEQSTKNAYRVGTHEMWLAVKRLWNDSNLDCRWSAERVLTEYEKCIKKRPEPYEEWVYEDGTKCVVMDIVDDSESVSVFTENGCVEACTTADLKQHTGRTYPQIFEVLVSMRDKEKKHD